ncbi:hypothetical protein P7L87_25615 [Vibrio parahaemolyticus]|nr:hypothetical protein [Vibrio parahaemolyticus]
MRQRLPDRKVGKASVAADAYAALGRGSHAPEPDASGSGDEVTRNKGTGSMGGDERDNASPVIPGRA